MEPHISELWRFEGAHTFHKYFVKKLLYDIVAMIVLKRFRIVTHCCDASFSIKTPFCKTNNIFYSLENQI